MVSTKQSPHVLIVGAGLAGLTLAQALRKKGISCEVFERDASIEARFQGWAIALHKILPDFRASLPDDLGPVDSTNHLLPLDVPAQFKFYANGKLVSVGESTEAQPLLRANRNKLRAYLAPNIDIKWGKNWTHIEETPNSITLHFDDGTFAKGDILVGADGVHSKVRGHLLSGKDPLNTLPINLIMGQTKIAQADYQRLMTLGHSAFIVSSPSKQRLMVALDAVDPSLSHANYYWSVNWVAHNLSENEVPTTHQITDKEELLAKARQYTADLDPKFTEVIRLTKADEIITPGIVFRDLVLDSLPNSRITLIGDSAHAMTPYRGEGGNIAMQDALNLARTIEKTREASGRDEMLALLKEYQDDMLARSRPVVLASRAIALDQGLRQQGFFKNWSNNDQSQGEKGHGQAQAQSQPIKAA